MDSEEFRKVLKTIKSGTSFTGRVSQHGVVRDLIGKVHVMYDTNVFFLCYDKGEDGDPSPDKHGYKHSWSIRTNNMVCIEAIYFDTIPIIINDYQIY